MNIAERVYRAVEGYEDKFKVLIYREGKLYYAEKFPTRHLAWNAGENWIMFDPKKYSYKIENIKKEE